MLRFVLAACLATAGLAAQTVEVRVFNAATGAGIPDFPLRFMQYGQTLYSGSTDAGGRFRIESAKEGPYTVLYQRGKYWPAQDSHLIGGSIALQVSGGAEPTHLDIGMYPMAKISGRVLDGAGKPVPKARINLSDETPRGGGMIFEADEKGEYSSEELWPGTFTLSATPPASIEPPESAADQELGWANTYYPNAASRELAAPIVVPPGGELRNMDIRLKAVPVHRIRGVVLDLSGNPVPKVTVTLDAHEPPSLHHDSKSDGTFEITQVVDGDCRLSTTFDEDGVKLRAAQWVHVKGRDLENVELRLIAPFSIQGKVIMEVPEGAPVPKTPRVSVRSTDMFGGFDGILPGIGFFDGNADGQGGFMIKNLYPGAYYILPGPAPAPYYLDSIRFGARDAVAPDAQILPGDLPLTVNYKLNGGTVRGTVEACGGGAVLLLPRDAALRRDGFTRRTSCDKDGRFEIASVRPGEYYAFGVAADDSAGEQRNGFAMPVEFDRNRMNRSIGITVRANEATLADLPSARQ